MTQLRAWWAKLTPLERRLVAGGLPLVAIAAVVSILRRRRTRDLDAEAEDLAASQVPGGEPAPGLPTVLPGGSGEAIGIGQLADFETGILTRVDAAALEQEALLDATVADLTARIDAIPSGGAPAGDGADAPPVETPRISSQAQVRVSPTGNTRPLAEYAAPGGDPNTIDSDADLAFIAQARGTPVDDPTTLRLVLEGSFGPVAGAYRQVLTRRLRAARKAT